MLTAYMQLYWAWCDAVSIKTEVRSGRRLIASVQFMHVASVYITKKFRNHDSQVGAREQRESERKEMCWKQSKLILNSAYTLALTSTVRGCVGPLVLPLFEKKECGKVKKGKIEKIPN
jgi:hypothetical protein